MPLFMEQDVLSAPVNVTARCARAVMTALTGQLDLFKELGFLRIRV